MSTPDLISSCIAAPIDWGVFERLVVEVLVQDDLPRLRKIGGVADDGVDAVDDAFYLDEVSTECVVQVTSERAQVGKFKRTVKRLNEAKVTPRKLVIVYRQPVTSQVRLDIIAAGAADGLAVDPRDESYLVTQLGKLSNGIFSRYFQDARAQVDRLLAIADPLEQADTRLMRAVLASVASFVMSPKAKAARSSLFDQTVLAVFVAGSGQMSEDQVLHQLQTLLPGYQIDKARVTASIGRLVGAGNCENVSGTYRPTEKANADVAAVLGAIQSGFSRMLGVITADVNAAQRLDDASKGYLQRNLRRCLAKMMRQVGPTDSLRDGVLAEIHASEGSFHQVLAQNLSDSIARRALASLATFISDKANEVVLATLARSYSALALRNLDPLGKRWQAVSMSNSDMVLDTDAILLLLIEELPEHGAFLGAIRALRAVGVRFTIPDFSFQEAVVHICGAMRTYRRFRYDLLRRPPIWVSHRVWNAVVRGFYYRAKEAPKEGFPTYLSKYFSEGDPEGFLRFRLGKLGSFEIKASRPVDDEDAATAKELFDSRLKKETGRLKAQYREVGEKVRRLEDDISCMLGIARDEAKRSGGGHSYLISMDSLFANIQRSPEWGTRPKVHLPTTAIVELAEMVCGVQLHDDQLVTMLFDPILCAAAEELDAEITLLAKTGVNLREANLVKLEWDLKRQLHAGLLKYSEAMADQHGDANSKTGFGIEVAHSARALGYSIDPEVEEVLRLEKAVSQKYAAERDRSERLVKLLKGVIEAAGQSKKAQARVNRVLREMGGLEALDTDDEDSEG